MRADRGSSRCGLSSWRPNAQSELEEQVRRANPPARRQEAAHAQRGDWLAKEISKSEHTTPKVQTAARMVTEAAENGGPMIFARMGVMQAINRHEVKEFGTSSKPHHWGKRKLKRDE
jgi:hypothetical protein